MTADMKGITDETRTAGTGDTTNGEGTTIDRRPVTTRLLPSYTLPRRLRRVSPSFSRYVYAKPAVIRGWYGPCLARTFTDNSGFPLLLAMFAWSDGGRCVCRIPPSPLEGGMRRETAKFSFCEVSEAGASRATLPTRQALSV